MAKALIDAAERAMAQGKHPYARQLLEKAASWCEGFPELERRRLLVLGRVPGGELGEICGKLPSLDEELLLRAEAALSRGNESRALALLSAAEDRTPRWNYLQGLALMARKSYAEAAPYLQKAETVNPESCWRLLEECYREFGDFRQAYFYACKQRK